MTKRNNKRSDLINLGLGLLILVLVNVLSQYVFTRADLTSEKRYTLSESTKELLKSLDDVIYFKVYLEGDFPQGSGDYKRLRDETRIMLDEFRVYAGDNIQFEFIDPNENSDPKARQQFQEQLEGKGLTPQYPKFTDDAGTMVSQKIYPWAIASSGVSETPIPLLGSSAPQPDEVILNHAVEGLEYELSNAIRKLRMKVKAKIAITQGHGEPDTLQLFDFVKSLREYYDVEYVDFHGNLNAFRDTMQKADQIRNKYSAIIIPGPDSSFTPQELFILDQFILYGGKALFLVDPVYTSVDSLARTGMTLGMPRQMGLQDLLFRYGVNLNSTLVEDLYCSSLVIPVGSKQTQFMELPWYYSPTILPTGQHPIVRNLDRIKFDFLSTLDTVETGGNIRKTILLTTSDKSRFLRTPTRVSIQMAMIERDPRSFDHPDQPVAALVEGSFDSYYKNKFLPEELRKNPMIGYKDHSIKDSKVIVVADGDVICNPVAKGRPMPLGYDLLNKANPRVYANKTFLLNCMNYLCDDKGLLSVRSREVTLRLLDRTSLKNHRLKWQLINILGPVIVVIMMGFLLMWLRRRRYVLGKRGISLNEIGFPALYTWAAAVIFAVCDFLFIHHSTGFAVLVFVIAVIVVHTGDSIRKKRKQQPEGKE